MFIRSFLARQLGYPSGIFGRLLMRLLNSGNAVMNDLTFSQLNLQPQDSVLEIGFGGGYLLEKISASKIPKAIVGIDPQADVLKLGNQKFKQQIKRGYIELKQASGENLPYENETFNKICTVNTVYFWSDPIVILNECWRVLKSQGKLIICYNSPAFIQQAKLTQHGFKTYEPKALESLLQNCGFTEVSTVSGNGGTGNGLFYCTSGLIAK